MHGRRSPVCSVAVDRRRVRAWIPSLSRGLWARGPEGSATDGGVLTESPVFRASLGILYFVSFAAIGWLLLQGASYYLTPLAERAHHYGYWDWKSGGRIGHRLGVVGAGMMVLMLGYSLRKRVRALRRLGPLSRWLDVHIFFGIVGPLLVVLHSAFKGRGLVALSFWSMIAVAASGVFGRYLYLQIPRTRAGEEMNLAALERVDSELTERLRRQFRLDDAAIGRLEAGAAGGPAPAAEARRRLVLWSRLHDLFHYWPVVHKPFAVVMYLFLVVHVVVAFLTGYAWGGP